MKQSEFWGLIALIYFSQVMSTFWLAFFGLVALILWALYMLKEEW